MKKFNLTTVLIIAGFGFVFFVAIILLAALAAFARGRIPRTWRRSHRGSLPRRGHLQFEDHQ